MKVYLIAGEPSGDKLGAELMAGLISCAPYELEFCGVGGPLMEEQGLTSLSVSYTHLTLPTKRIV